MTLPEIKIKSKEDLGINHLSKIIFIFLDLFHFLFKTIIIYNLILLWGLGIGDWGLGIGDWGLGPIPNPQSPIPNPHEYNIFLYISLI